MSIVIWLLTFVLILLSVFLVLVVLAQKSKSDGGVGAALGGGMTEATFGADTGNVLATMTRNGTICVSATDPGGPDTGSCTLRTSLGELVVGVGWE